MPILPLFSEILECEETYGWLVWCNPVSVVFGHRVVLEPTGFCFVPSF